MSPTFRRVDQFGCVRIETGTRERALVMIKERNPRDAD
jgi:hypothetical protein